MSHLYVHIPFCRSRCSYCDFASETLGPHARAGRVGEYIARLREELTECAGARSRADERGGAAGSVAAGGAARFETIYVGGGTPTVLDPDLLLPLVHDLASRSAEGGEFTIEANPGTIDAGLLERLDGAGVTRISLGVQSFSTKGREALGRRVTEEEVTGAVDALSVTGWRDWSLDLVFGIPGQTWAEIEADIDAATALLAPHISLYDLVYTPAYERRLRARQGARAKDLATASAERRYAEAVERLEAAGYRRYEVSNFARPGYECRHNLAYWRGEDYLGIGAAAVSTEGAKRRTNPKRVVDYVAGRTPQLESLSTVTRLWEKAMLGLRTSEGVDETEVSPVLDKAARARLLDRGCLESRYGKLRLNAGFLDVSNSVIATLLIDPEDPRPSTPAGDDTH